MKTALIYLCQRWRVWGVSLALVGCATVNPPVHQPSGPVVPAPVCAPVAPPAAVVPHLRRVDWQALPGWQGTNDLVSAWPAWLLSCHVLERRAIWHEACRAARQIPVDNASIRTYFTRYFQVFQTETVDGTHSGLITGYFEPQLMGSFVRSQRYHVPLYRVPPDLLDVDLSAQYPALKAWRLRGRLQGRQIVPYWSRAQIEGAEHPLAGNELLWVDDALAAFFLQIQGSGQIVLPDGKTVMVGYADQNGYPYQAIGHVLVAQGALRADSVNMASIVAWARAHPAEVPDILAQNPSYVFFRLLPGGQPLGAMGLPLTAGYSIAIDPRALPLGAPVWLETTEPDSDRPLQRLMLAQDTGGAIHGNVRADVFWGMGDQAASLAGNMQQSGRLWVLLPQTIADPDSLWQGAR